MNIKTIVRKGATLELIALLFMVLQWVICLCVAVKRNLTGFCTYRRNQVNRLDKCLWGKA